MSDNVAREKPLIIYPNPSHGQFSILSAVDSDLSLRVFTLSGALAASRQLHASGGVVDVDLSSSLTPGTYIVSVTSAGATLTSKLMVW